MYDIFFLCTIKHGSTILKVFWTHTQNSLDGRKHKYGKKCFSKIQKRDKSGVQGKLLQGFNDGIG